MRHPKTTTAAVLAIAATLGVTLQVHAQERGPSYLQQPLPVAKNAAEFKLGTGLTQGFGNLAPGRGIDHVAGPGVAVNAQIDYRFNRYWSAGAEGQFQSFEDAENASARGFVANLGPTYHFFPNLRGHPWIRLATGYRLLWENTPLGIQHLSVLRHGFEPIAAKVGFDVRVARSVAFAPVVGADLNVFIWEGPANGVSREMSSDQVATFLFIGLEGRFDVGGQLYD